MLTDITPEIMSWLEILMHLLDICGENATLFKQFLMKKPELLQIHYTFIANFVSAVLVTSYCVCVRVCACVCVCVCSFEMLYRRYVLALKQYYCQLMILYVGKSIQRSLK